MMELTELNPYVRYIGRVSNGKSYEKPLLAYDHRLFYVHKGGFLVEFEGETRILSENMLLIFPPAVPYRLVFQGDAEYSIINFDFRCRDFESKCRTPEPKSQFSGELVFSDESVAPFDQILQVENCGFAGELISQIEQQDRQEPFSHVCCSALLKLLLGKAAQLYSTRAHPPVNPLVEQVKTYILEHFSQRLTNGSIAAEFGYHPYYLGSLFQKCTGTTLHDFLTQTRLQHAMRLLTDGRHSISEVAFRCGYSGAAYFSEVFLANTGLTPSDYRKLSR